VPIGDEQAASPWRALEPRHHQRQTALSPGPKATSGGTYIDQDVVLAYGKTYNGRTILPTSDGTRFANDRTGHGRFVSIENVYAF
jgi:hypothetical protein